MDRQLRLVLFLFLSIIFLTSCNGSEPIYSDDFSSIDSGWNVFENDSTSANYDEGSYKINLKLRNQEKWTLANQNFGNVAIEVDATKLNGTDDNSYGVVCKFQNIKQYYAVIISSDGAYMIEKRVGGIYQRLTGDYFELSDLIKRGSSLNQIRVECGQDYISLFANGKLVDRVEEDEYLEGDVGLIATTYGEAGLTVSFDNFSVYELP